MEEINQKILKNFKEIIKKNEPYLIMDSYDAFKKDLKKALASPIGETEKEITETINSNKNNIPIFDIQSDDIEYNINFPIIPYNVFYIATLINIEVENEMYNVGGFFVLKMDENLIIFYCWSKIFGDGLGWSYFILNNKILEKPYNEIKLVKSYEKENQLFNGKNVRIEKNVFSSILAKKFILLMKKLIYKISTKEYSKFKYYSYGNYTTKEIIFETEVRSHKRHFWKDSGKFKIPFMSKEELTKRGYDIDELVFRGGELRREIPFRIIGSFKIGENKENTNKNKKINLLQKKVLRQEYKLLNILKEIFKDCYIRIHDRRTLNGLELDFNIPELRIGVEYDGEQHFDKKLCEEVFKSNFEELKKRDRLKEKLCKKKNITLIRIKFDEPLTLNNIKKRFKQIKIKC